MVAITTGHGRRAAGFTMMEILVVLSIITIILALLSPTLFELAGRGDVTKTQALIVSIKTGLKAYATNPRFGTYPPTVIDDSFLDLPGTAKLKPNGTNLGIESLVFHLTHREMDGESPFPDEESFINTDDDAAAVALTFLGTELFEYADAWGHPLIYFNLTDIDPAGSDRFEVLNKDGDVSTVRPLKSTKFKGAFAGRNDGFQIISLGPDGEFDTRDDVVSWNVTGSRDDDEEEGGESDE